MQFNFKTREIIFNVITLPNGNTKHVETGRTYKDWIVSTYAGNNEIISITCNGDTRTYKVKEDSDFIFSIKRTFIKAREGAEGLFRYIDREVTRETERYENGIIPEACIYVLPLIWKETKPLKA